MTNLISSCKQLKLAEGPNGDLQMLQIYSAERLLCQLDLCEVGGGSFGTVRHAKHEILGDVAVKCITIAGGERSRLALKKKLFVEHNKLQECHHPNVVTVFGVTEWSGAMGILMEFCPGGNLRHVLLDESITLGLVLILRMNLDIASGLAHIHNCGLNVRLIHGDLKLENILLTVGLICKIADCGTAQIASYTGSTNIPVGSERPAITLYYAAPEKLLDGARPKKEQDAYSCSMIQYTTLSRGEPYQSQFEFQRKLEKGLRPNCEAIQELKEESSGNNREIVEIVEGAMVRCWDQDPSSRPSMAVIRDKFQALMAKQDPVVISQQVADAVKGMNIQTPPQNPSVPLKQFSTEFRMFRSVGWGSNPDLQVEVPASHQDSNGENSRTDRNQPEDNTVVPLSPVPAVTRNLTGFLVIGGHDSERDCVKWNVTTRRQQLPNLRSGRQWSTSARVNNDVYVMGGLHSEKVCEKLDLEINERWVGIAELPEARSHVSSSVVLDHVYLVGGRGKHGTFSSCLLYDGESDQWINSFDMLQPRDDHGTCSMGSSIYCIGGYNGKQRTNSCERHDARSKESETIASLNYARSSLACVEIGEKIYAIGGYDDGWNHLQTVEEYEPRVNQWTCVSPLAIPRRVNTACVVDGLVYLVSGGGESWCNLKSVEVYDPTADVWSHCFDLEEPVFGATVVAV